MLVNGFEVEIEWGDCDPAGIVFYPRYFAYFDAATNRLFEAALGMKKIAWRDRYAIVGIPMVDTGATFHAPCRFGDQVRIDSQPTAFRRSSFDIAHRLHNNGTLAVEARETRVWTGRDPDDPGRLRGVEIPQAVKDAFAAAGERRR